MSRSQPAKAASWEDADRLLARMGKIEKRVGLMRSKADAHIAEIEKRLEEGEGELLAEISDLRQELERFFRENAEGLRSRTLDSGRVGLRLVQRLEIARPPTTLHRLAERGLGDCIRLRQEIDRQALARLDHETLRSLGVKPTLREVFFAIPRKEH